MSKLDGLSDRYPQIEEITWSFSAGIIAAGAAALLFRLVDYLGDYQMGVFERTLYSWSACYIAMLAGTLAARYEYLDPFEMKRSFLKAFILSFVGMISGIFILSVIGYYTPCDTFQTLLYDFIGLAVPQTGAVFLLYVFDSRI
jgi:hypothetical protein